MSRSFLFSAVRGGTSSREGVFTGELLEAFKRIVLFAEKESGTQLASFVPPFPSPTCLAFAARHNEVEIIKWLCEDRKCSVNELSRPWMLSPAFYAFRFGAVDGFSALPDQQLDLCGRFTLDAQGRPVARDDERTPLFHALLHCGPDPALDAARGAMLQQCLEKRSPSALLNLCCLRLVRGLEEIDSLGLAIQRSYNPDLVKKLLSLGAELSFSSEPKSARTGVRDPSSLALAAEGCNVPVLRFLIDEHKALLDWRSKYVGKSLDSLVSIASFLACAAAGLYSGPPTKENASKTLDVLLEGGFTASRDSAAAM